MEESTEVKEVRIEENKKVNHVVAKTFWRAALSGVVAGSVAAPVAERGFTYLFSDLRAAEMANDVDAFLSIFGRRLESFRSQEAEEELGLTRAIVLNLSEHYEADIDWQKLSSMPETRSLKGSSLVLLITDSIGPGGKYVISGMADELGGPRKFVPGVDDYLVVVSTHSQEEMSAEARNEEFSRVLVHEIAHIIDIRQLGSDGFDGLLRREGREGLENLERSAEKYTETNRELWRGLATFRPIVEPEALSQEELNLANDILVKLQVEAQLARHEPARPYWKEGIEV